MSEGGRGGAFGGRSCLVLGRWGVIPPLIRRMLTYLSSKSQIIPITMAGRSSSKLFHSKSYASRRAERGHSPEGGGTAICNHA